MEVKELVKWCILSFIEHEKSWDKDKAKYKKSEDECIENNKPNNALDSESKIASCLFEWKNDLQDWYMEMFEKSVSDLD